MFKNLDPFWFHLIGALLIVFFYNVSIVVYFFAMLAIPFDNGFIKLLVYNLPFVGLFWYLLYNDII